MFTIQDIWNTLYRTHNTEGDTTLEAEVRYECRKAYYELCGHTSWSNFRDNIAYEYDEDEDGMWLPANLIIIDQIGNSEYDWKKADQNGATKENTQSRMWYISEYNRTPVASGADITIANGSKTFTGGANITDAMVGEYIRLNGQSGVYKLESTTTLTTEYYGDALTGDGAYEVRPIGTQKIKLVTPDGQTDETQPTIYFCAFPAQLYDGTQPMLLPTSAMLELASNIKLFGVRRDYESQDRVKKDLYGSQGRYEGELERALSRNPEFIMPVRPESFGGLPAGYGASRRRSNMRSA